MLQLSDIIAGIAAAASTAMDADLHARKVAALPPKLFAEGAPASLGGEARLRPTVGAAAATVMVGQPCVLTNNLACCHHRPIAMHPLCFDRPPIAESDLGEVADMAKSAKDAHGVLEQAHQVFTDAVSRRTDCIRCCTGTRRFPPISFPFLF